MKIHSSVLPNNIYQLKEGHSHQQLSAALNRCLSQAEALAMMATIIDAETIGLDTMNTYLWALSDMIQEARWLYRHLSDRQ